MRLAASCVEERRIEWGSAPGREDPDGSPLVRRAFPRRRAIRALDRYLPRPAVGERLQRRLDAVLPA
jgi:hypothetical protein